MPEHTPVERERARLLAEQQDTLLSPVQLERQRLQAAPSPVQLERARLEREADEREGGGIGEFFKKAGTAFLDISRPGVGAPRQIAAQTALLGGIAEGAILKPAEALSQLPALLGLGIGEKTTDFLQRSQANIHSIAEELGLASGMTKDQIAFAYGTGDFIGFVAPISASIKAATFLLRTPLLLRASTSAAVRFPTLAEHALTGNLVTDMTAGAIFGGIFKPGDSYEDRLKHLLQESAAFGVIRIGINAVAMPLIALRRNRVVSLERIAKVDDILEKYRNGEAVVIETGAQSEALSRLLSEEAYITNSAAAQDLLARVQDESVILQAVIDASETGSGIIKDLAGGFAEVRPTLERFKSQFPALKFDAVRGPEGSLIVRFGSKGLNNKAKAQLKKEGRIAGDMIEKNGVVYEYVRMSGDRLVVKTDAGRGKQTTIINRNITDQLVTREALAGGDVIEGLYQDFSRKLEEGIEGLNVEGVVPESEWIRRIREADPGGPTITTFSDEARRAFDVGGAVVYPEELGLLAAGEEAIASVRIRLPDGRIFGVSRRGDQWIPIEERIGFERRGAIEPTELGEGRRVTDILSEQGEPGLARGARETFGPGFNTLGEATDVLLRSGGEVIETIPVLDSAIEVTQQLLRSGDAFALEAPQVMSFESMVEQWMRNSTLPEGAPDAAALRAYFGQRAREDFWRAVPSADMKVIEKIRAEQHALVEAGEIPFEAYAWNKGFSVEPGEGGLVTLRSIRTGERSQFGSERVALTALDGTIHPEMDILRGSLLPPGTSGIGGFTGGFDPTDGVFTFDGKVPTREYLQDLPLATFFRDNMDTFTTIEGLTGVPLFSKVFNQIDLGINAQRAFYEPWSRRVESVWKGLRRKQRVEVAEFWRSLEGTEMTVVEEIAAAREAGLSPRQIKAFRDSRDIFDVWGEMLGLKNNNQWVPGYYARIQPYAERTGGARLNVDDIFRDRPEVPPHFKFFAEEHRVGDMPMVEMDPEIVMQKYVRTMGFKQNVAEVYEQGRALVAESTTPKIRDLPKAQADDLLRKARAKDPTVTRDNPILPPAVRRLLGEYLVTIRGNPASSRGTMLRWGSQFFEKLGVKMDPKTIEQYVNNGLSMMYGSAMGLKPALWARDATQNMWMTYTRMGARHGGSSLKEAMTLDGFREVADVGAIRSVERGIASADAIFESIVETNAIKAINPRNPFHLALASTMRWGLRTGNLGSRVARKTLVPYGSQDDMNRAWSYFWFKQHTAESLSRYEAGKISWDKFREDGLPFFHKVIKEEFGKRYNAMGREDALRWIGKQGTDETNFIYGVGAQPAWMQNPVGRFVGMFGTWPMWAIEAYFRRVKNATPRQRAALYARTLALTGAFANISIQTGISMWNWIAPTSMFGWGGGPAVDYTIQLRRTYQAPLDQKADALRTLARDVGRLALPGQGFVRDFRESLQARTPAQGAMMMLLGKPVDDYNYSLEFLFDPRFNEGYDLTPQAEEGLRALQGLEDFPSLPLFQLTSPVRR